MDASVLLTVDKQYPGWFTAGGRRSCTRGCVSGIWLSSAAVLIRTSTRFLRDFLFILFCETKAEVFKVKLILKSRGWTQICPTVLPWMQNDFACIQIRFELKCPGFSVCFFLHIYKWRWCLLLKEMQWEEHNFFWLSVWSPQQGETVKRQTNLYFWTNCSKPGAYNKLRIIWCKIQFCHPLFTLLSAPCTSFLLALPVALATLLKPVSSSKTHSKTQSFLLT